MTNIQKEPSAWKVGDKVRITKHSRNLYGFDIKKGHIVELVDYHKKGKEDKKPWLAKFNKNLFWISETQAELITE